MRQADGGLAIHSIQESTDAVEGFRATSLIGVDQGLVYNFSFQLWTTLLCALHDVALTAISVVRMSHLI
jgi:hypothetical protein